MLFMTYALVTGASKGIGKAIAYNLAARKINLLIVARSENLLAEISDDLSKKYEIKVKYLCIDLGIANAAESVFEWITKNDLSVNILINNAGYGLSGKFEKYTAREYVEMMNVNMVALVKLTSLLLPVLKQHQRGHILNIASTAAYQAVPYLSVYAATKSFVVSFSRSLQYELRNTRVSVTCVSPGGTDTGFAERADISETARKTGEKVNMSSTSVAAIAVNSMFKKKKEVVTGFINKLGAFLVWLAPKRISEKVAGTLYQ